jgi:pyridoxal phosphate enzyme (YggS family)
MVNVKSYEEIISELKPFNATLVAVSKKKPLDDIQTLQSYGQKIFGENYEQELLEKHKQTENIDWHFIGHLQSKKVKSIAGFVKLIHSIDSLKLLEELNKQAGKFNRIQNCLLQIHIAREETKFGFSYDEATELLSSGKLTDLKNIYVKGLMGMASVSDDVKILRIEFSGLRKLFDRYASKDFGILSMGMTSDYKIALEEGSNMVRIGSAIFGER